MNYEELLKRIFLLSSYFLPNVTSKAYPSTQDSTVHICYFFSSFIILAYNFIIKVFLQSYTLCLYCITLENDKTGHGSINFCTKRSFHIWCPLIQVELWRFKFILHIIHFFLFSFLNTSHHLWSLRKHFQGEFHNWPLYKMSSVFDPFQLILGQKIFTLGFTACITLLLSSP